MDLAGGGVAVEVFLFIPPLELQFQLANRVSIRNLLGEGASVAGPIDMIDEKAPNVAHDGGG